MRWYCVFEVYNLQKFKVVVVVVATNTPLRKQEVGGD